MEERYSQNLSKKSSSNNKNIFNLKRSRTNFNKNDNENSKFMIPDKATENKNSLMSLGFKKK